MQKMSDSGSEEIKLRNCPVCGGRAISVVQKNIRGISKREIPSWEIRTMMTMKINFL